MQARGGNGARWIDSKINMMEGGEGGEGDGCRGSSGGGVIRYDSKNNMVETDGVVLILVMEDRSSFDSVSR